MNRSKLSMLIAMSILGGAAIVGSSALAAPPASKPSGNKGSPDIAALAGPLANQQVQWGGAATCGQRSLDELLISIFTDIEQQCATITVPRDWHNPGDGNTITLSISRAADANVGAQHMLTANPGGPGGSGRAYGVAMRLIAPEVDAAHYMVGFDPRGVGSSTPLRCQYVPSEDPWTDNTNLVEGCLDNPLTPYINSEQTAYDMDFIRYLMGKEKTSYIGYSYGTWLGSWYQRVFSDHAHRFVLDSNTDLSRKSLEATWDIQPKSRDRQFQDALLPYIARNDATYGLGTDPLLIRQRWEAAGGTRSAAGQAIMGGIIDAMYSTSNYPAAATSIATFINQAESFANTRDPQQLRDQIALFKALMHEHPAMQEADLLIVDDWVEAMLDKADKMAAAQAGTPITVNGAFSAIRCQDGPWNSSQGYWTSWVGNIQRKFPWIGPVTSAPECATWPETTSMPQVKKNYPATLLIQSELDAATPYEAGLRSAQTIKDHYLVSVDNEGSHGLYPYGDECVDGAVENWLLRGQLPADRFTTCPGSPLPNEDQVYPVAGAVKANGKIKLRLISPEQREVNRWLKSRLGRSAER
ncbi:alpha/beta fold hydrolase [Marilutibacter maris]|nr:alpha/beta hydrolase [Lysobacter maris]